MRLLFTLLNIALLGIILFPVNAISQAGGTTCPNMEPICTVNGVNFQANANGSGSDVTVTEPGNNYDCLGYSPNPSWFYLEIATAGDIIMNLSANTDIDFVLWGPYSSLAQAQANCGNHQNVVPDVNCGFFGNCDSYGCSYSTAATETPGIPNAQVGQVYVLLITNYANNVQNITLTQTGGTGSTNCDIVFPSCAINNFTANIGACNAGVYNISGILEYSGQPSTGSLIVEDCFGTQHVVANAPFASSMVLNYNINGLPANGAACDLTAYFSDDPACTIGPINYTAPTCVTPTCSFTYIDYNISACDPINNTFGITGSVEFVDPPASGILTISDCNGNSHVFNPPFVSPTNYSIQGINSDGATNCSVTATFSADPACTINLGPYDNPANCVCESNIGTFTNQLIGDANGSNPWTLCFGDELDIIGNSDFVPSEDFSVAGAAYDPGVWLLAYDCPPTVLEPNDILTDPCFLGVASSNDQAWTIINSTGDGSTIYFVPVTMYSMVDGIYAISINAGAWCYDLGPVYPVTFLPEMTTSFTQNCQNGTATVTINGGDPAVNGTQFTGSNLLPATASFSNTTANNGATITINGLQDGDNWSFDIADVNGCPISVSGTFTSIEDPSFNYSNITYCQDDVDPIANVTGATGGSFTSSPAGLVINASTGLVDLSASTVGIYTITYTTPDPICFDQATFDITINPVPTITTPLNEIVCTQYVLPAIAGTNLTGNEAYYTGAGASGTQMNPGDIINTLGTTTIYIYDATGTVPNCTDETSFTITIVPELQSITCPGPLTAICNISEQPPYANYNAFIAAGGSVTIDPLGNIDPSTFNLVSEVSDGNTCPEVITRTYELADECGTIRSCQQTITINDLINPTGTAPANITIALNTPIPAPDVLLITNEADNCGIPTVLWTVDVSDGGYCPEVITRTYRIEDACGNFITVSHTITIGDGFPDAEFIALPTSLTTTDTEVDFTNESSGAISYVWNFGDGSGSNVENPSHSFPNMESGSYVVQLIAASPLGCQDTAYQTITVVEDEIFYVPNTFTPDGDSYNEYFQAIFYSGYDPFDFTMLIYNRWGEIIWESHDWTVGWNGTYGGKIVPDGVYTWKIEVKTTATDERRAFTGHLNLIR